MLLDILKGFIVGICASVPLGPIAILVIQKSLSEGHKSGFLAGLGACLWQALPHLNAAEIRALIKQYASQAKQPDNQLGYGIPNIYKSYKAGLKNGSKRR